MYLLMKGDILKLKYSHIGRDTDLKRAIELIDLQWPRCYKIVFTLAVN